MLLVVGILTSSPFALNPYPWSRARSVRNNKEWNNKVSQATSSFTSRLPGLQIPEVQRRKWKVLLKWHKPATSNLLVNASGMQIHINLINAIITRALQPQRPSARRGSYTARSRLNVQGLGASDCKRRVSKRPAKV